MALGPGVRVGIEHGELTVLREKRLMLVRSVQIDEVAAERFQDREGAGRAVHELLVTAAETAFHDERISLTGLEAAVLEERIDLIKIGGQLKDSLDRAEAFARANEVVIGALAEDELESPDDHRLARAGLAGHTDEA